MTQNKVNRYILIQNTVVWRFIFLNLVPKTPSLISFGPKTSKCFVLNETWCIFSGTDSELDSCFLKFCLQNILRLELKVFIFLGQILSLTSKGIVLNETRDMELFKVDDSEFDNCFLKCCPQNTFLGKTKHSWVSGLYLPKKGILRTEFQETIVKFRISTLESPYVQVSGQSVLKKGVLGTEFKKAIDKFRISTHKTSKYQVSFKTKQLWFLGPNIPQKGILGMEFNKAIVEFWISTFEYLFRPTFI